MYLLKHDPRASSRPLGETSVFLGTVPTCPGLLLGTPPRPWGLLLAPNRRNRVGLSHWLYGEQRRNCDSLGRKGQGFKAQRIYFFFP